MTLPNKTHQANTRARKAKKGLVRIEMYVPKERKALIKDIVAGYVSIWAKEAMKDD
jgi:hypothetical protein